MKFPSILKVPRHRRFNVQPRYYDPIKEDIEDRTSRIKREIMKMNEGGIVDADTFDSRSRIAGSFSRNAQYGESKTVRLRFVIMLILFIASIGYIWWGNIVLYLLGGIALGIILMRRWGGAFGK